MVEGLCQQNLHRFSNHFLKHTSPCRPLLLLLDGHSSHYTLDLIKEVRQHGVIIFCLPPNTTGADIQSLCGADIQSSCGADIQSSHGADIQSSCGADIQSSCRAGFKSLFKANIYSSEPTPIEST